MNETVPPGLELTTPASLPASPVRRVVVILNQSAGSVGAAASRSLQVRSAFRELGVDAQVECVPHHQMSDAAQRGAACDVDAVVAGGGDGTVGTVAGSLIGLRKTLGVLPLGTLNHFARDLGIPVRLDDAVRNVVQGVRKQIDVGRVNERVFINNSSLGLYPHLVIERDGQPLHYGIYKWRALCIAVLKVFRAFPLAEVRLNTGATTLHRKTPLVFVGNNVYGLNLLAVGHRPHLDRGELCLYIARTTTRRGALRLGLRALCGRLNQDRDFESQCLTSFVVETKKSHLKVALDGEVVSLRTPLRYEILPRALEVIVPGAAPA